MRWTSRCTPRTEPPARRYTATSLYMNMNDEPLLTRFAPSTSSTRNVHTMKIQFHHRQEGQRSTFNIHQIGPIAEHIIELVNLMIHGGTSLGASMELFFLGHGPTLCLGSRH
jgi:hypothetical protein